MERAEIVIVGAGAAGLPAAIRLAEAGIRPLVIEKRDHYGGTLEVAGGQISAGGVPHQQAQGHTDSWRDHYDDVMRISEGRAREDLVELATRVAPEMIAWFESLGVVWDPGCPIIMPGQEPYSTPRTYWAVNGKGIDLLRSIQPLADRLLAEGRIDLRLNTRVTGLERGADGWRVTAEGPDGESIIEAPIVLLATGGYGASRELWQAFHPELSGVVSTAQPHTTGDGFHLATALGAVVTHEDTPMGSIGMVRDPANPGRGLGGPVPPRPVLNTRLRRPTEIWVDGSGARFIREDHEDKRLRERLVMAMPDQTLWLIFDAQSQATPKPLLPGWTLEMLDEESTKGRFVWRAATVRDLAAQTGMDPQRLAASVETYNQAVATGQDPLGRTALGPALGSPLYALQSCMSVTTTYAGIDVDSQLRVLDGAGQPFPGLYAVGELIGCGKLMGQAKVSGMALGPALSLGLWIGDQLALQRVAVRA